jgi:hypothetical protein
METREEKRKEVGRRGGKEGEGHELKKRNEMWKNSNVKREGKENRGKKSWIIWKDVEMKIAGDSIKRKDECRNLQERRGEEQRKKN